MRSNDHLRLTQRGGSVPPARIMPYPKQSMIYHSGAFNRIQPCKMLLGALQLLRGRAADLHCGQTDSIEICNQNFEPWSRPGKSVARLSRINYYATSRIKFLGPLRKREIRPVKPWLAVVAVNLNSAFSARAQNGLISFA